MQNVIEYKPEPLLEILGIDQANTEKEWEEYVPQIKGEQYPEKVADDTEMREANGSRVRLMNVPPEIVDWQRKRKHETKKESIK